MIQLKADLPKDVDEYLRALSPDMSDMLQKLRKAIRSAAPEAKEKISYGMPAYEYKGILILFAAFKDHCSIFGAGKNMLTLFAGELKTYKTIGATLQFTPQHPLPASLIRKIIKLRVMENEERAAKKMAKVFKQALKAKR